MTGEEHSKRRAPRRRRTVLELPAAEAIEPTPNGSGRLVITDSDIIPEFGDDELSSVATDVTYPSLAEAESSEVVRAALLGMAAAPLRIARPRRLARPPPPIRSMQAPPATESTDASVCAELPMGAAGGGSLTQTLDDVAEVSEPVDPPSNHVREMARIEQPAVELALPPRPQSEEGTGSGLGGAIPTIGFDAAPCSDQQVRSLPFGAPGSEFRPGARLQSTSSLVPDGETSAGSLIVPSACSGPHQEAEVETTAAEDIAAEVAEESPDETSAAATEVPEASPGELAAEATEVAEDQAEDLGSEATGVAEESSEALPPEPPEDLVAEADEVSEDEAAALAALPPSIQAEFEAFDEQVEDQEAGASDDDVLSGASGLYDEATDGDVEPADGAAAVELEPEVGDLGPTDNLVPEGDLLPPPSPLDDAESVFLSFTPHLPEQWRADDSADDDEPETGLPDPAEPPLDSDLARASESRLHAAIGRLKSNPRVQVAALVATVVVLGLALTGSSEPGHEPRSAMPVGVPLPPIPVSEVDPIDPTDVTRMSEALRREPKSEPAPVGRDGAPAPGILVEAPGGATAAVEGGRAGSRPSLVSAPSSRRRSLLLPGHRLEGVAVVAADPNPDGPSFPLEVNDRFQVRLTVGLTTSHNQTVLARPVKDVFREGRLVLPKKTVLRGRVEGHDDERVFLVLTEAKLDGAWRPFSAFAEEGGLPGIKGNRREATQEERVAAGALRGAVAGIAPVVGSLASAGAAGQVASAVAQQTLPEADRNARVDDGFVLEVPKGRAFSLVVQGER